LTGAGCAHSFALIVESYCPEAKLIAPPGRIPERISHRGAHETLPENSIPAFLRAFELGADAIELDVHATRDGVVVVHHDPVLKARRLVRRENPGIAELSSGELAQFELDGGVGIPTLQDVLDAVPAGASVYVEVKAKNIEPLVVRCIRESAVNCAVHSFDHRIVQTVKKIFPAIRTGVLEVARHVDPLVSLAATGAQDLWQEREFIDEDLVARVHSHNARVVAWTANDSEQWKTLRAMGVDGICTDRIGELAAHEW
jgi:glycerophosphoryl diester phosphodiesterase